jgi:hypothetical protein
MSRFFSASDINVHEEDIKNAIKEEKDEDWTSCWNCAKAVALKLGETYTDNFYLHDLNDPNEILEWDDGVSQCMIEHENGDTHEFALEIAGNHLCMIATYGGQDEVIRRIFPRDVWVDLYKSAMKGNKKAYRKCFGLAKETKTNAGSPIIQFVFRF